jgi:hypothetical protein
MRFRGMKKQTDYRDERSGAYDPVTPAGKRPPEQVAEAITPHQAAQSGADVRPEPLLPEREQLPEGQQLPEGLVRPPKGPYSRKVGRRSI